MAVRVASGMLTHEQAISARFFNKSGRGILFRNFVNIL
jgi:hypothetical protein